MKTNRRNPATCLGPRARYKDQWQEQDNVSSSIDPCSVFRLRSRHSAQLTHSSGVMSTMPMTLLNHWAKFAEIMDSQLTLLVNEPTLGRVFSAVYTGPRQLAVWESGGSFGKWKICIDITLHMGFNEICFQALEFEFSGIRLEPLDHRLWLCRM